MNLEVLNHLSFNRFLFNTYEFHNLDSKAKVILNICSGCGKKGGGVGIERG
jgi:hypothetical protein